MVVREVSRTGIGILASVSVLSIALNVDRLRDRVFGHADAPHIESLAVLPVKNFSGDPGQEFFADGMTDDLIAGLAITYKRQLARIALHS